MNVVAFDPGLNGGGAALEPRGEILACFGIPINGDCVQPRIDAATPTPSANMDPTPSA